MGFQAESMSISGCNFNDVRGDYVTNIMNSALDVLRQASSTSATYDSSARHPAPRCLEGTREEVLRQIRAWIDDPGHTRILWLNGTAGAGKSTLAQTVAEDCAHQKKLGASFFFSEGTADRSRSMLFPSIAYQLLHTFPSLKSPIEAAVQLDATIPFKHPRDQFRKLIADPLLRLETPLAHPVIIVVDSLHESESEAWSEEVITVLADALRDSRLPLRFIITSQPEPYIQTRFKKPEIRPLVRILSLHRFDAKDDIRLFLRHRFKEIYERRKHTMRSAPHPWPTDPDLDKLVEKSSGLFLYASTVGNSVEDRTRRPQEQLDAVLGVRKLPGARTHADLDQLYSRTLSMFPLQSEEDSALSVVGAIVLLFEPLSAKALEDLLVLHPGDVSRALEGLHGFFDVPDSNDEGDDYNLKMRDEPIQLMHSEFREFLTDHERSKHFSLDPVLSHGDLAHFCLTIATKFLKQNVCVLEPRTYSESDLKKRCDDYIPSVLRYACRYWASHLLHTSYRASIVSDLRMFVDKALKPWIETLSLLGDLHIAVASLKAVQQWLKKSPYPAVDLVNIFSEAEYLVHTNFESIHKSALQVYQYSLSKRAKESELEAISEVNAGSMQSRIEPQGLRRPGEGMKDPVLTIVHVVDEQSRRAGFGRILIGARNVAGNGRNVDSSVGGLNADFVNVDKVSEAGAVNVPSAVWREGISKAQMQSFCVGILVVLLIKIFT